MRRGDQYAVVTEVGAGLREYTFDDRPVIDGFEFGEQCSGGRGQTLIPWPNRVDGGRYSFDGGPEQQLPLTEPARGNAIHGLTRWVPWNLARHVTGEAWLTYTVYPQPGWPYLLSCVVRYALTTDGLRVTTTARNLGDRPCPYATGAHPYLTVGTPTIDTATVRAPGATWFPTDGRGIPTGREPVDGTPYDLRSPAALGDRVLDTAYTDLERDDDGLARVRLTGPDGRMVTLWQDAGYPYLQLFTGDTLGPDRRRRGLAVEPMTAAPNALRTGEGLLTLGPGEGHEVSWGITPD
jgi:aldose 1-epimerase